MRSKLLTAAALVVIGSVATAVPASATTRNCSATARMCVYYNSTGNGLNAEFGTDFNVPSFNPANTANDIYFKAGPYGSNGAGSWVWNNAAAVRNPNTQVRVGMYQNSNYAGQLDIIEQNRLENLVNTKNDNASLGWGY